MIKTKRFRDFSKEDKYFRIDEQINDFLKENNITREKLIDIKFSCTGYSGTTYGGDHKKYEKESALIIYEE